MDMTADHAGYAAESMDTLAGAQGALNREWADTQIALGEVFIPYMIEGTKKLIEFPQSCA